MKRSSNQFWKLVVSIHEFFSNEMLIDLATSNRRDVLINKYAIAMIAKKICIDPDRLFIKAAELAQDEISGEITAIRLEQVAIHPTQETDS